MLSEWNVTIVGAVLCVIFSWFLGIVSRSQEVQFGKTGLIVGIVGVFILAGMAVTGPLHVPVPDSKKEYIMSSHKIETNPEMIQAIAANFKIRALVIRTKQALGKRPDRDHIPYEHSDGTLEWVTKSERRELRRGE